MAKTREASKRGQSRPRTLAEGSPVVRFLESPQWIAAFERRIGETPAQRLRWIVEFTRRDLDVLHPGELEAVGWDLRQIATVSLPRGSGLRSKMTPLSADELRTYQRQIDQGLRGLLGKTCEWRLLGRPVLQRRQDGFCMAFEGDDEAAGILGAVGFLILETGDRLRACADAACGAPFVATRRQSYCSAAHSQRVRNARRS